MSTQSKSSNLGHFVELLVLFIIWYGFNAGYNVYNAKLKTDLKYPIIISALQLVVGLVYAIPLWALGLRKVPKLNFKDLLKLFPIAALNAIGHTTTVIAMFQKGGGSFAHVIKASEPVVSVLLGLVINGVVPKPLTAISLIPVSYGVAYASTLGNLNIDTMSKELTTLAAVMAMIGNFSFSLRSILRRNLTSEFKSRTNLDPANDHAVVTIYSALLTVPFCFIFEKPQQLYDSFLSLSQDIQNTFLLNLFICGMCFYIYNELQNKVLGSLGPVPTAVGNTLKRVAIFAALYFFTEGETFPWPKIVGCVIAIVGCLLFAIFDAKKI